MNNKKLLHELTNELENKLLQKWYPLSVDEKEGGYFTNITYDWKLEDEQDKMMVTQARHMWTTAKAAKFFGTEDFKKFSEHGFDFLRNKMWDKKYGGFYQVRSREGNLSGTEGWFDEKRTYGNAFGIYGLAALYDIIQKDDVLNFAREVFYWIEENAFDKTFGGYFQFLTRKNKIFNKKSKYKTKATDWVEVGFKDQNSSIHLLEAYTELYHIWPEDKLKKKLTGLLKLIRDVITHPDGYLRLFFEEDWTPVSFRNSSPEIRETNYCLDHVSFGHDYETAFLMLEASYVLQIKDDTTTLQTAKKMLDHAIENGWDKTNGGFFDEGYYFEEYGECKIIDRNKTWWCQAEGLNALLLFYNIFPNEKRYIELFEQLWEYVKIYLLDKEHGGWYWGSLEKEPEHKTTAKGNIWKASYHDGRALMNCILMSAESDYKLYRENEEFAALKERNKNFIEYWKKTAELIAS